jgi:hypothetical protein
MGVETHQVVLDEAPVFRLVLRDDAEGIVLQTFGPVYRFALRHVLSASLLEDIAWNFQANDPVDAPLPTMIVFPIVVEHHNLVAEEPRRFCASMGDQSLRLGQFQSQGIAEEISNPILDVFGFVSWPAETEQKVSGAGGSHPRALAEPDMT